MTKPSLYFICSRKSSLFLPSIYTCFASTTFRDVRIQALWGPWDPQAQYKMAFRDSPTRSSGNCLLLWLIHFCLFLHRCHCFAQGHLLWSLQVFRNSLSLHWCHYSDSYRTYAEKLDRQHHISAFKLLILMTVSKPGSLTLNVRVCYASYFKEKKNHLIFLLASHISMRRNTSEISVRGSYLQLNSDTTEAETEKQAHHSEIHATSHIDTDSLVLRDRLLEITKQRAVHFANPPVFLLLFLLEEKNVCLSC